jgi:hypothetical protein
MYVTDNILIFEQRRVEISHTLQFYMYYFILLKNFKTLENYTLLNYKYYAHKRVYGSRLSCKRMTNTV